MYTMKLQAGIYVCLNSAQTL